MMLFWTVFLNSGIVSTYGFCYLLLKSLDSNSYNDFIHKKVSFKEVLKFMFYSPDWNKTEPVIYPYPVPIMLAPFGPIMGVLVIISFLYILLAKDKAFEKVPFEGLK